MSHPVQKLRWRLMRSEDGRILDMASKIYPYAMTPEQVWEDYQEWSEGLPYMPVVDVRSYTIARVGRDGLTVCDKADLAEQKDLVWHPMVYDSAREFVRAYKASLKGDKP